MRKGEWLPCQFSWVYHAQSKWPRFKHASPLFWPVQINIYTLTNSQQHFDLQRFFFHSDLLSAAEYPPSPVKPLNSKSLRNYILNEYTAQHSLNVDWSRSLALSSGLQKSPVKDMVHAPIPPCYLLPLKGWQLHHSESEISSHTWQPRASSFFFPLNGGTRGSHRHHRICFISLGASALSVVILWRLSMTSPPTLCCYFQYKISIQGLLDASHCLFFRPAARFLLNARQIEHFRNWHFSGSVCQYRAPRAIES